MNAFFSIVARDLRLGFRSGGGAVLSLTFFALIVVLAPFGLGPSVAGLQAAAPGIIWTSALLATLLGLERLIQPDIEDGTLDLLRLSALPLELVALAKILSHWLMTGLLLSISAPLLAPLLGLAMSAMPVVVISLLLGTPGLSAIGACAAGLSASVQRGGMVLALLALPLYVPFLIFGAGAVSAAAHGGDAGQPLLFLSACTLLALVIAPIATAAALRFNGD